MIEGTAVIFPPAPARLFRDAAPGTERLAGLPTPYVAWRANSADSRPASSRKP